jgi:hypothetical protein
MAGAVSHAVLSATCTSTMYYLGADLVPIDSKT